MMSSRYQPDIKAYTRRAVNGPCFICRTVAGDPAYPHHLIYRDEVAIAFLDKYPTLYGHTLVAPIDHREGVTADFNLSDYLELQKRVYALAEAVRLETAAERVYILSLGSQQANSHVHWHIAPLPPGVPLQGQQYAALDWANGVLDLPDQEMASLARRIAQRLKISV